MGELSIKRLGVLMATAFGDMLGFALVLPLLPLFAKDFGVAPVFIGLLLASHALVQVVTAPLWGRFSDRVGRKPVIVGGQALSSLAFLLFAAASVVPSSPDGGLWSWPILMLLLSRMAQGAGGGTVAAVLAYVSDSIEPEQRAQALGWITACSSAGVMLGPAIGSLSLGWSGHDSAPGLIAAGLCALNMAFAWSWLPESHSEASRKSPREKPSLSRSIANVVRHPRRPAHTLIWVYASGMLAFIGIASVISLYLSGRFGVDKEQVGYYYLIIGFVSVIMRAVLLGPLVKRIGEVRVARLGALVLVTGFALAPFGASSWWFLLAILSMPAGTALLFPSTTSLTSRYSDPGESGALLGVQQAFGGVARLLAPILALGLFQLYPPSGDVVWGGALPFWSSSTILFLTLLLALRIRPGRPIRLTTRDLTAKAPDRAET